MTVSGFKPEIDGTDWLVAKTTHTVDGSGGFVTALELERGGSASAELASQRGQYVSVGLSDAVRSKGDVLHALHVGELLDALFQQDYGA